MRIQLDRIPFGGKHFVEDEPAADYEITYLDFQFHEPIHIDINAQVVSGNLVVSGKLSTKIRMTCSRCVKAFSNPWEETAYHFDCQVLNPNDIIDLTENIREAIIVTLPVSAHERTALEEVGATHEHAMIRLGVHEEHRDAAP